MDVVAGLIFAGALATIAFEWVHRTKVALVGAGLTVVVGVIDLDQAVEAVDWATLGLLAGMMIIVGLTEKTGIFTYLALRVAQLSRGRPFRLVFLLSAVTGVLSAFLDNLTAILLVVPITLLLADVLRLSPVPLVLVEIFASNVGGTATLIGDPPNIMIGTHVAELSFVDFIVNLAPVALVVLGLVTGLLYTIFRRDLVVAPERIDELEALDPGRDVRESRNVRRSVAVLVGTVVVFFLHAPLHLEPAVVALGGATVLLLVAADDVEEALERVEWSTLFFFIGLFVMVGGLEEQGVIERIADVLAETTGGSRVGEGLVVMWGAAAGSALVDNIPFTAAMIPVVDHLQADGDFDDALWWALALGACFGGNATVVAAAANVAATGVLERSGREISFGRFLLYGLPVTIVSLAVATAYLLLFQL
ncbi:MAG: ArsB/NhaD family transporter [Thermoleophilia bacterium]|nr:ArsB/NhaD family transporter [Thermoleophilia bacterium]MDQ3857080.1 ArsB/NhaD family transporter [Actinomycetota bacterium]